MSTFSIGMVHEAASRLSGHIVRTPLLESPRLNEAAGTRVLVKAESLQLSGAFKMRGALNRALTLTDEERNAGLIAFSTGNHGQAVAAAAAKLGTTAVIVMPKNAPTIKIDNCRWWGAEVQLYDPLTEHRETVVQQLIADRGLTLIPPFDDPRVIAGQATAGLEIAEDLDRLGITPDSVVLNTSGGGLAAGVAAVLTDHTPSLRVTLIEPAGRDKMAQKFAHREYPLTGLPDTIMDALSGPNVGVHTHRILAELSPITHTVTDTEALHAMAMFFTTTRLVVEPGGAAALAHVLAHPAEYAHQTVVLIASGGNVAPATFIKALETIA